MSDTWFRALSTSFITQFGKSGVLHPTPAGHGAIADAMVRAVDEFTPFVPALDVTVTVDAVRITENTSAVHDGRSRLGRLLASTGTRQLSLVTQVFATRRGHNVDGQQVVYSNEFTVGKWSPVPAGDLTFDLRVGAGDELDAVFGLPTGGLVIRDHQPLPLVRDRRTLVVSGVRERDGLQVEVRYVIETAPLQLVAP
ncbi:MAG: hypothetical protein D6683_00205 [Actinomyces sp.]|nr:MAG: hypothetical protein D6683_00205 [Actinomyces sp.]